MPDFTTKDEREVGRIVAVSNYRVTVLLDPGVRSQIRSYPHHVAVVTQIGGYLLFPVAPGESAVGIVVGASEDEAIEPEQEGVTLRLARARRVLKANLIGQLREETRFETGVSVYPSLETPAQLPTEVELRTILEYQPSPEKKANDTPLLIGSSPVYRRQAVTASFNDLLARPFAIIGNTGSGKSCSVASIVQSALASFPLDEESKQRPSQAKFIILDINGEYGEAFTGKVGSNNAELNHAYMNGLPFTLPLRTFNLAEMISFFGASAASQVPVLERVITLIREDSADAEEVKPWRELVQRLDKCLSILESLAVYATVVDGTKITPKTAQLVKDLRYLSSVVNKLALEIEVPAEVGKTGPRLDDLATQGLRDPSYYVGGKQWEGSEKLNEAVAEELNKVVDELEPAYRQFRRDVTAKGKLKTITADSPIAFEPQGLERDALFHIAISSHRGQERIQEHIATMRMRIHRQLADKRWSVFTQDGDPFENIIGELTGQAAAEGHAAPGGPTPANVVIVDCSMLAHDVLPFFCAVFARLLLDLRAHADRTQRTVQPYVLVLEEAHNYLRPPREGEPPASPWQGRHLSELPRKDVSSGYPS